MGWLRKGHWLISPNDKDRSFKKYSSRNSFLFRSLRVPSGGFALREAEVDGTSIRQECLRPATILCPIRKMTLWQIASITIIVIMSWSLDRPVLPLRNKFGFWEGFPLRIVRKSKGKVAKRQKSIKKKKIFFIRRELHNDIRIEKNKKASNTTKFTVFWMKMHYHYSRNETKPGGIAKCCGKPNDGLVPINQSSRGIILSYD